MAEEKKVFILTIPLAGHVNPIIEIANALINEKNINVVIYATENFKKKIESIGAEFRNYDGISDYEMKLKVPFNKRTLIAPQLIEKQQVIIENNLKKIAKDIIDEKPNVIFYEFISLHAKYVMRLVNEHYNDNSSDSRSESSETTKASPPDVILFSTFFIYEKNVYPNKLEQSLKNTISRQERLKANFSWSRIRIKSYKLAKRFKIQYRDPYREAFELDNNLLNLVLTFPELQPRSHLFDKNNKFVGSCLNSADDEEFEDKTGLIEPFLKSFAPRNPLKSIAELDSDNKLVYISLGTMFTDNVKMYLTLINAFKEDDSFINNTTNTNLKMHIVVSVGRKCYEIFNIMLENDELKLAENMIIVPCAPQQDILKRASLFITHAGMNSVSESINYAVPMICIPVTADQPQTAYRVTTELGLGITLDFLNLKSGYVRAAVFKILEDASYSDRCIRYSKISREYNGAKNAADIIDNFINDCNLNG